MNNNAEMSFLEIPELTRDEKREIWLRRTGNSVEILSGIAGVTPSTLSRHLRSESMPSCHHILLIEYGVPAVCLPLPSDKTRGRKARSKLSGCNITPSDK